MKSCPQCNGTYPTHFSVCPQDGSALRSLTELIAGAVIREKYQILEKLGEGGMGVVYKAQHLHFKEVCALKLVSSSLSQDPTFIQRFNAEALLMRRLDHPHALRVHDIDKTEDGNPFIVMEFVDGKDLASLLREGALEPPRAVNMVMQACDALGAAHRLGIIHRDIKPTNIMVSRAPDGSDYVKVFDFGIAKVKEGSPLRGGASLTQTGMVVGTPAYMSPEQCMGARSDKLDGRTDLYSLGIVLYEALTGRLPFSGETPMELVLAHIQKIPPDPRTIRAELPPAMADVVLRALEKDPEKRFASAEEMCDALKVLLDFGDLETGGTVRVMPRRTPTPPPRTAPASAALTDRIMTPPPVMPAAPPAAASAPPPVQPAPRPVAPERQAHPQRVEPPPAKRIYLGVIIVAAVLVLGGVGYVVLSREQQPPPLLTDGLTRPPDDSPKKAENPQKAEPAPRPAEPEKKAPVESAPAKPARERPQVDTNAQETERMLQAAATALDAGRYDEAVRTFEAVLLLEPGNAIAQGGLNRAKRAKAAEDAVLSRSDGPTRVNCSREPSLRSGPGAAATTLTIVNRTGQVIFTMWLNAEGRRVPYNSLRPGESVRQATYVGHPWLVSDGAANCIAIYLPAAEPATVEVRP